MKQWMVMIVMAGTAMAAPAQQKKSAAVPKKAAAKTEAPVNQPPPIPKGAVEVEPGIWKHKDKDGKVWLWRRTQFGLAKYPPEDADTTASEVADLNAFDEGDSVRFERRTPFGVTKWTRKKTELAGSELAAWKRVSEAAAAPKPAAKSGAKE